MTTCPRCEVPPLRNHDEVWCLVHGTVNEPLRAWDTVGTGADCVGCGECFPSARSLALHMRHNPGHKTRPAPSTATKKVNPSPVCLAELALYLQRGMRVTARDVAGRYDVSPRTAERWLAALEDLVPLERTMPDGRTYVWRKVGAA